MELLASLTVTAVLLALSLPRYAAWRDATAAREAASELARALGSARETAVLRAGFVSVVLDSIRGAAVLDANGGELERHELTQRYGVTLSANRDSVVYDPHGLGYGAASMSVVLRRGSAADTVTVSRMGRVRW
jgi:Tfp pilus assembly protein FimT